MMWANLLSQLRKKGSPHVGRFSPKICWTLAEDLRQLRGQWNHIAREDKRKKREKRIETEPAPLGGSHVKPLHQQGDPLGQRELPQSRAQSLLPQAKARDGEWHGWSAPQLCAPWPETHVHWCKQGLEAGARASEGQPGDRTGVGCAETARRGWILVRLQPTGYAEEAWAHHSGDVPLLRACGGRGGTCLSSLFPAHALQDNRTQATGVPGAGANHCMWAPGTGMSHGQHHEFQGHPQAATESSASGH